METSSDYSPTQERSCTQKGKGKKKGRGRGRGRGRGSQTQRGPEFGEIVPEERNIRLRTQISQMTREELQDFALQVLDHQPGLLFNLLQPAATNPGGYHPPPGGQNPAWCICTYCREMPSQPERVCCMKQPGDCVSHLDVFQILVLHAGVLHIARALRNDVLAMNDEDDLNLANRHAAYRQFILWQHGRLGPGNRKVIPSCCVWRIRDRYPDAFGQYRGFVAARLG